ncbi:MAG: tetratricopeptide repeat protein [Syntrophaceae bacterium]|nr:tetratricopeptide repeat protein [Syntrophaceae bacterium]
MNKKYTSFIIIFFLIVASCAAFCRIVDNDFVNYDDTIFITENSNIQSGFNLQNIKWAFFTTYQSYWHPLTWLSITLDWTIFGSKVGGHHLVNLLLHIGAVIFLFLFLNKTTKNIWPATFAAALFALHPLRVESVAWAAERKDVLSMFFGMTCIYAYALYAELPKLSRYFFCFILFIFSLLSKPMMVTLPCVLLLLDYWPLKRWQKALTAEGKSHYKPASLIIWEKAPFFILSIFVSILSVWAQNKVGTLASGEILPFFLRCSNAIIAYTAYIGKTFWPFNLAVFYPYEFSLPMWKILISFITLVAITIFTIYHIRKLPFLFVGWFWYLGTLIPVIGLMQVGQQAMADRYTYLPSIGIAIMFSWGIPSLIKSENTRKKVLFPTAISILFVLAILTWRQCGYWKNGITLFSHVIKITKNNYLAHNIIGFNLLEKGKTEKAVYHFSKAILYHPQHVITPDYVGFYLNRATAYTKLGKFQLAIEDYNRAISLKPDYTEAYNNRGNIYGQLRQFQLAINDFNKAISLDPDHAKAYNNRGLAYSELHHHQNAIKDFNKAIDLNPDYANAYNNRANIYLKQDYNILGCSDAQKACKLGNCTALKSAKSKGHCQ